MLKEKKESKKFLKNMPLSRMIILCILSFFISCTSVTGFQIDRFSCIKYPIPTFILIPVLCVPIFFVLYFLFIVLDKAEDKFNREIKGEKIYTEKENTKKDSSENNTNKTEINNGYTKKIVDIPLVVFLISFFGLGLVYLIFFFAFYPGLFVFDARTQYISFLNNNMSEFHPLLHTVMLGKVIQVISSEPYSINHGVAVFVAIQLLFSISAFSTLTAYAVNKCKSISAFIISFLFFAFFPPIVWGSFSVTKDTYFCIFFIFSVIFSVSFCENPKKFFKSVYMPVLFGICITLMCIFRNNCIYAIPFLFLFLLIFVKDKKVLVLPIAGIFIFLFILYKGLFVPHFANSKPDGREMYSVPFQQLMKVYTDDSSRLDESDKAIIERLIPEEGRKYIPGIADGPKSVADMNYYKENKKEVVGMYLRVFKNNPGKYIEAFLCLNCGFWYPGCELTLYPDGSKGYWPVTCFEPAVSNSRIPFILHINQALEESDFLRIYPVSSYIFAPGTFLWIFVFFFAYAIDRKKIKYIPFFAFILFYTMTFLLGPVALVRYVMYLFAILPLYFAVVVDKRY